MGQDDFLFREEEMILDLYGQDGLAAMEEYYRERSETVVNVGEEDDWFSGSAPWDEEPAFCIQ